MTRKREAGHVAVAVAAAALTVIVISQSAPRAQRGGGGGGGPVLVPVTASSVLRAPDTFVGRTVSMMASVDALLSETAFTVDQDKTRSTGEDVLVLAPTLVAPVELNSYVTVQGRLIRFDPADVARLAADYEIDLAADVVESYRGRLVVVATVVLTSALVDLAKVPPPPLTPEEEAFDGVMKQVSAANGMLRTGMTATSAEQVSEPLNTLKTAFGEAEAFFKARGGADDAVGWAQEAQQFVEAIQTAVAAGDWEEAGTASSSLAGMCSSCHGVHRTQLDDGTYRVKAAEAGR